MNTKITVHKNETLKFLKLLVENFETPKLTYLHQDSTQEVRFIPAYLDEESEIITNPFSLSRKKIENIGKLPAAEYEFDLKRPIFLEFNNNTSHLYLNIVADRVEASNFIAQAEDINKLNNNNIFNCLKNANNKKYYIHQERLIDSNELKKLNEDTTGLREKRLISLFKIYVPIFLKRLDILFPEPY